MTEIEKQIKKTYHALNRSKRAAISNLEHINATLAKLTIYFQIQKESKRNKFMTSISKLLNMSQQDATNFLRDCKRLVARNRVDRHFCECTGVLTKYERKVSPKKSGGKSPVMTAAELIGSVRKAAQRGLKPNERQVIASMVEQLNKELSSPKPF